MKKVYLYLMDGDDPLGKIRILDAMSAANLLSFVSFSIAESYFFKQKYIIEC
jgi:hypothetical protein